VATPEEALAAIPEVVGTIRTGGTDIQEALLASFAQIREAVEADPDLAAAQVVLVTDGEAPVDAAVLERARAEAGRMPIGVSIVALGVENPALRQLAARQRERGERVFYQFVDDQELASIVSGVSAGLPVHLPPGASGVELSGEVRRVVGEIAQHLRGIDAAEIARAAELPAGLGEVGLSPETALDLGSRARLAALENDRVTLEHSFLRLFPHPDGSEAAGAAGAAAPRPPARRHRAAALADVLTALATVTEVVDLVGASALERQADAVEILERLLRDTGVAPWEYAALVQQPPPALREALRAVHGASRFRIPGGGPTSGLAATAVTGSSSTS
jgi:hypothetical protein